MPAKFADLMEWFDEKIALLRVINDALDNKEAFPNAEPETTILHGVINELEDWSTDVQNLVKTLKVK